jgi:periplasmic divalent cation tolerance protein
MIVVYFTAENEEEAKKISEKLVEEKLAACANYFPISSIYWWEGEVQKGREVAVLLKTEERLFEKIVKRIKELHPYELPVIEKFDVKTYPEVEIWVKENVK